MQVGYGGDAEAALLTYSSHHEANSAYRSSEPVFNNRFIKLFWHNKDKTDGTNPADDANKKLSVRDRLGAIPPAHKLQLNNTKKNQEAALAAKVSQTHISSDIFL